MASAVAGDDPADHPHKLPPCSPPGAAGRWPPSRRLGCGCAVMWRSCAISLSSRIRKSELEPSAAPSGPYRTDRGLPPGQVY